MEQFKKVVSFDMHRAHACINSIKENYCFTFSVISRGSERFKRLVMLLLQAVVVVIVVQCTVYVHCDEQRVRGVAGGW